MDRASLFYAIFSIFFKKTCERLPETDIQMLVTDAVPEGMTIEYKQTLSLDKPEEKKELVRDITAFANTQGGDIVCGVKEDREKGLPQEVCGIPITNWDQLKQSIENVIRDGTNPRMYGLQIPSEPIELGKGKFAVVIRIPRSFSAPHMVVCGGDFRFYYRTSTGRERLDVVGLRMLFGMADTFAVRAQAFRAERLARIQADDTPQPLLRGPKFVLHMLPFGAFTTPVRYDLSHFIDHPEELPNLGAWSVSPGCQRSRYNLDGVVSYVGRYNRTEPTYWYTQCYRNGTIEAVNMQYNPNKPCQTEESIVTHYEDGVLYALPKVLEIQRGMGVAPPIFAFLTLLGVKGRRLSYKDRQMGYEVEYFPDGDAFREEHLVLPEVVFEDFKCAPAEQMEPVFEIVWNAAGLTRKDSTCG